MQDIIKPSHTPPHPLVETAPPDPPPITTHRKRRYLGLFGLLGLIGLSQGLFFVKPSLGVYASVGTFMVIVAIALMRESFRHIGIGLAIVPFLTILIGVLPISDQTARLGIYYGVILVLSLMYRFFLFHDPPFVRIKLRHNFLAFIGLVLVGVACGVGYFFLPEHSYPFQALPLYSMIAGCFVIALTEELFFRGLIQQKALRVVSPNRAIIATAVLYAVMSVGSTISYPVVAAAVFSGLLSLIYRYVPNPLLTFTVNVSAKLTFIILVSMYV